MKKLITITNEKLYHHNSCLLDLVSKHGTPLRVTFLDVIKERVISLKETFNDVIEEKQYTGKFIYVNANKANYEYQEIAIANEYGDGLECSSLNDLLLTKEIIGDKSKYIICNGYKEKAYVEEIVSLSNDGFNIMNIIDSIDEYKYMIKSNVKACHVGLRVHLPSLYHEEGDIISNDRFGLIKKDFDYVINDIVNHPNLILDTIHFHQRGFDFEKDKFLKNINIVFNDYYVSAKKKNPSVINLDIGGGTPLPALYDFNYQEFAKVLIDTLMKLSKENSIKCPNIISENGKYSQKDSTVNIYEVVGTKNTDEIPWYIVNGSLLIAMPEMYALGEEIEIMPINRINNQMIKTRLASISCDCDDVYYEKALGYISLPPKDDTNKVYIAILGTGSYQNSMAGKGGIHHCLIPQEKDVVVYSQNGNLIEEVRGELQNIEAIKKLSHLKEKR